MARINLVRKGKKTTFPQMTAESHWSTFQTPTNFLFYHQIKKLVTVTPLVTNPLDDTLEALHNIQDTINTLETRKTIISEKQTLQDYNKIISHLE